MVADDSDGTETARHLVRLTDELEQVTVALELEDTRKKGAALTNTAKHGALSKPKGRVEVGWTIGGAEEGRRMTEIVWRERGWALVRPPERRGFGSRLSESGLAREFGAEVALNFAQEGVECRIRLPLASPGDTDAVPAG